MLQKTQHAFSGGKASCETPVVAILWRVPAWWNSNSSLLTSLKCLTLPRGFYIMTDDPVKLASPSHHLKHCTLLLRKNFWIIPSKWVTGKSNCSINTNSTENQAKINISCNQNKKAPLTGTSLDIDQDFPTITSGPFSTTYNKNWFLCSAATCRYWTELCQGQALPLV